MRDLVLSPTDIEALMQMLAGAESTTIKPPDWSTLRNKLRFMPEHFVLVEREALTTLVEGFRARNFPDTEMGRAAATLADYLAISDKR